MIKRLIIFSLMTILALASSAKIYIPLVKSVPPSTGGGGDARANVRSSAYAPLAYYENNNIYIQFPTSTASSVIITNDSTNLAVISKSFGQETSSVQINISTLNHGSAYNISVNAYGNWWVGYFDFNTTLTEQKRLRKGITSIVVNNNEGRNYGVYCVAGNASSGWNYGVSGILSGTNGGTGVYGSSYYDDGFNTKGRFAGLFHGDIKTTDAVYASAYNTLADSRINQDMKELENGYLNDLMQLSVFKYGLKQLDVDSGDDSKSLGYYINDSGILDKEHYGLSGQEISNIFPNLVTESQDGYLSINYMEMVPLLIKSIQELKTELDAIKTNTKVSERTLNDIAILYQNVPNPFSDQCIIKCTIPDNINQASFYLFDYNGRQIQHRVIKDRGNVQIVVDSKGLEAGLFLYSLVADGELVDTKRMIYSKSN